MHRTPLSSVCELRPHTQSGSFDDILDRYVKYGTWNRRLLFFSVLSCLLAAFNHLSIIFLAFPPEFSCAEDKTDSPNLIHPLKKDSQLRDSCLWLDQTNNDTTWCSEFTYNTSIMYTTLVSQWDLVCERKALLPTLTSTYMVGIVLSILSTGIISDYCGRRKSVLVLTIIHIVASFLAAATHSYTVFLITRMVIGGSIHSIWACLFIIIVETTPKKERTFAAGVMNFGWQIGSLLLTLFAFLLRDWGHLQLVFAVASLFMLPYFFILSKSPRWLMENGQYEEADKVLRNMAQVNGVTLDEEGYKASFDSVKKGINPKTSSSLKEEMIGFMTNFLKMVMTPEMRKRTLLLAPTFFAVGLGSYGIHFAAKFANMDIFAVTVIKEVCNFVTIILLIMLYKQINRTYCLAVFYALAGMIAISFFIVPTDSKHTAARPVLLVITQALFVGNYFLVDTYAPELYPTNIRNFAFNVMDSVSKMGSALAPFIVDLAGGENPGIPPAVFGAVILMASINFFFLPETLGRPLPKSVEAIEDDPGKPILHKDIFHRNHKSEETEVPRIQIQED